ncbi:MAG: Fic family protein, partial [Campylobacteraceae bacterium]|nr:Fic family protein [Campylobacteraceae bacterium]
LYALLQFIFIHPFRDGNGRLSRLLLINIVQKSYGFVFASLLAVYLKNIDKKHYHNCMKLYRDGDVQPLRQFHKKAIEWTIKSYKELSGLLVVYEKMVGANAISVNDFYKKVIVPFSQRMLEQQVEDLDDIENKDILEDEDNAEDTLEKFRKARKKVEEQLGIGDDFNEDALKYDVLLEKLKTLSEQKSEEVAGLLESLINNSSDFDSSSSGREK